MQKRSFQKGKGNFFYLALILFVCCLPLSEFLVSASGGILLITAWIEDPWTVKIKRGKKRKLLLLLPAVFLIYVLSACITGQGEMVLYDLRKALFFVVLPLAFFAGKEISSKQKRHVLLFFSGSVFLASFYALINWMLKGESQALSIHNASLITHIRFSFQLILSIWFLTLLGVQNFRTIDRKAVLGLFFASLLLLVFLFLQQSLTGLVSFFAAFLLVLFLWLSRLKKNLRIVLLLFILGLVLFPVVYVMRIAYPFYFPEEVDPATLPEKTQKGNPYFHDPENRMIENGNFVYLNVCEPEMREEWNKRSALKYDSLDQNGYRVSSTLIRYLTSRGLKKDAEGIHALSDQEMENIRNGVSNCLFSKKKWSLYPRVYKSVWEFYVYTHLGYVNNQSLSQRIEFSKAALHIIKDHPWIGVGTGNWKQAFYDAYKAMNSSLQEQYYASSHNQYLNYLVKFGIIGFLAILFLLVYPVIRTKRYRDPLFLIFLLFMVVANFADSNFESHMGSSFFVFFYCFFLGSDGITYLSLRDNKRET
jgi:O-antigen ligase